MKRDVKSRSRTPVKSAVKSRSVTPVKRDVKSRSRSKTPVKKSRSRSRTPIKSVTKASVKKDDVKSGKSSAVKS